jgi:twinkle protein
MNYTGDIVRLNNRSITEETCRKFNVRVDKTAAGYVLRLPYYSSAGSLVAFKERTEDKQFSWVGKNEDKQLFGQQLFGTGKTLVITEGEVDALSIWQARSNWPVVSIPNGAAGAKKALEQQLNWCLGFSEIILLFDSDPAGIKAAQDCASLFPPERVFIGNIAPYKDANEALVDRNPDAIRQAIWNKKPFTPQSIVDGRDIFDLVSKPLRGKDADWPFQRLNEVTGGLRLGELVCVTAGSGVGKSTFCGETAQCLVDQGFKVGYIALEESVQRTALRLMTVKANAPLHLNNQIPEEELREAFDKSVGSGSVFLRDGFGSVDPDVILNDIRFMCKAKGVSWIILDHLSILLSGNADAMGDERKTIDLVMTKLRSFVAEVGIGMILISHLRRSQNDKGFEDGAQISLGHLRGSQGIPQLSDLVVAIQRSVSAGENHSKLVVLKNRFTGRTGDAGEITYSEITGRMSNSSTTTPDEDYEF